MNTNKLAQLQKKREELLQELRSMGPLVRGSIVRLGARKQIYLSIGKDKKTKLLYLGEKRLDRAQQYSDNYKRLQAIVEEMTLVNMQILKLT
ncbi:MAG: hypothetical protein JW795_19845, partial [Chitinivibrionales bacterium]|nr:hypothetical protein [Chitinivibrionales bacterium]